MLWRSLRNCQPLPFPPGSPHVPTFRLAKLSTHIPPPLQCRSARLHATKSGQPQHFPLPRLYNRRFLCGNRSAIQSRRTKPTRSNHPPLRLKPGSRNAPTSKLAKPSMRRHPRSAVQVRRTVRHAIQAAATFPSATVARPTVEIREPVRHSSHCGRKCYRSIPPR